MNRIHSDKNLQSFCDKLPKYYTYQVNFFSLKPTQADIKEMTELFMLIVYPVIIDM